MATATDSTDRKDILAEKRTESAYQRTLLAEERTFSAWARTGLAAVAAGFALVQLMPDAQPNWLIKSLGVLFIAAGGAMFALGFWTYRRAVQAMPKVPFRGVPMSILAVITAVMIAGTAAALVLVFTT